MQMTETKKNYSDNGDGGVINGQRQYSRILIRKKVGA